MDEKITKKLEELILKAIDDHNFELTNTLINLRLGIVRIKSFEE